MTERYSKVCYLALQALIVLYFYQDVMCTWSDWRFSLSVWFGLCQCVCMCLSRACVRACVCCVRACVCVCVCVFVRRMRITTCWHVVLCVCVFHVWFVLSDLVMFVGCFFAIIICMWSSFLHHSNHLNRHFGINKLVWVRRHIHSLITLVNALFNT